MTEGAAGRRGPLTGKADVWLVLGSGLAERPITGRLAHALAEEFGDRFAVVRSDELLLGVRGGRLTLHDLDGCELAAPRLAYGRVWTPVAHPDREITLLRHLEAMGTDLLNPADAVLACLNKFWQLQQLALAGLPVPDTRTYADAPLGGAIGAGVPQPCVVKAVRGHRGEQVFLAPDAAMLQGVHSSLGQEVPYLFQEYVESSHGRDLRVVVVDGLAAGAQVRTAAGGEFRSNLALGGTATPCTGRYRHGEDLAVRAAAALGLGVAGVDLLFTPDGGFTICEVNANVGWRKERKELTAALVAACRTRLKETDRSASAG
ncbi:RimK family alpha-L-glutamate ligase [Streptomyces sp. NPDC021093]|uniref:RimK family alpha-L-glutamate ligase n=1 Tax=Streptomyces sp. NPDC021093 TaxID=3365112 RepID=UPI0037BB3C27